MGKVDTEPDNAEHHPGEDEGRSHFDFVREVCKDIDSDSCRQDQVSSRTRT